MKKWHHGQHVSRVPNGNDGSTSLFPTWPFPTLLFPTWPRARLEYYVRESGLNPNPRQGPKGIWGCRPAIPKVCHSEGRVRIRDRVTVSLEAISLAAPFGMVALWNAGPESVWVKEVPQMPNNICIINFNGNGNLGNGGVRNGAKWELTVTMMM